MASAAKAALNEKVDWAVATTSQVRSASQSPSISSAVSVSS
jgi:hypothetical protein